MEQRAGKWGNRAKELDLLRGAAVVLMIVDHFFFDLWGLLPDLFADYPRELKDFAYGYWGWDVRLILRPLVLFIFFALTGICSSFSRNNLKRGGKLFAVAMVLTGVTFFAGYLMENLNFGIAFGVLHCIALSLLLVGIMEKQQVNKWAYLDFGILLWVIAIAINLIAQPVQVSYYREPFFPLVGKSIMGFVLCGGDSFAFPEVCGQIFIGVFLGKQFYGERKSLLKSRYRNHPLTFLGRHSLWVYFAHQLLLPLIAALVLLSMGYTLSLPF
ncbi:MAG: DUF1624 domain-containing protein [Oscillospiraceae bacterium]|nr:DUF1624 domain-containing protein [Oscillospiraceae bacterium]